MKGLFRVLMMAFVVVVFTAVDAEAQSVDKKCNELAQRTMDGAMVRVNESGSVRSAVASVESRSRRGEVEGYRVVIFSDNGQYAGDNARNVLDGFRKNHPHINAYMVYESPYFKVSVGDCLTLEEASHLMSKLEGEYPELFPKREVIKFSDLSNVRQAPRIDTDSLTVELEMQKL
jgi:hypothetical protein